MYQFLIGNVRHSGQPDWISYIEILLYQFLIGNVRHITDADADAVEVGEVSISHR